MRNVFIILVFVSLDKILISRSGITIIGLLIKGTELGTRHNLKKISTLILKKTIRLLN